MDNKRICDLEQPKIGELIYKLRQINKLTQQDFAVALGVTYSTINRWEKGRSKPSPLAVEKIMMMVEEVNKQDKSLLAKYFVS